VVLDGVEHAAVLAVELLEERLDLEGLDQVGELGARAEGAEQFEAVERGAAGLAGAEEVGVAARGGVALFELAVGREGAGAGREGEAVVGRIADEEGDDGIGLCLADEARDEIAQAGAVALEIDLTGHADFEHGDGAVAGERDAAELRGGHDGLVLEVERLRPKPRLRGRQQLGQEGEPTGAVVAGAEKGLELGAGHGSGSGCGPIARAFEYGAAGQRDRGGQEVAGDAVER